MANPTIGLFDRPETAYPQCDGCHRHADLKPRRADFVGDRPRPILLLCPECFFDPKKYVGDPVVFHGLAEDGPPYLLIALLVTGVATWCGVIGWGIGWLLSRLFG